MTLWVESLTVLLLVRWETLGKLFNILEPQLPHLKKWDNNDAVSRGCRDYSASAYDVLRIGPSAW